MSIFEDLQQGPLGAQIWCPLLLTEILFKKQKQTTNKNQTKNTQQQHYLLFYKKKKQTTSKLHFDFLYFEKGCLFYWEQNWKLKQDFNRKF